MLSVCQDMNDNHTSARPDGLQSSPSVDLQAPSHEVPWRLSNTSLSSAPLAIDGLATLQLLSMDSDANSNGLDGKLYASGQRQRSQADGSGGGGGNRNSDAKGAAAQESEFESEDSVAAAPTYHRIMIDGDEGDGDYMKCASIIAKVIQSRQAYKKIDGGQTEQPLTAAEVESLFEQAASTMSAQAASPSSVPDLSAAAASQFGLSFESGIFLFHGMKTKLIPWETYVQDIQAVYGAIENGPCLSTARTRLTSLTEKFRLYLLLNSEIEGQYDEYLRGGGVYAPCTRVDNRLNLHTSVPAPVLLDHIMTAVTEQPRVPLFIDPKTEQVIQLRAYLEAGGVTDPKGLTVEGLGLHPTLYRNKFLPHDMFSYHLNPAGTFGVNLLKAFLSTDGPSHGDLCGILIRAELERREYEKHQLTATEMTLDLHGHNPNELTRLAAWVRRQGFNKFTMNQWVLNVQRRPPSRRGPNDLPNICSTFGDQLSNLFFPMFMATLCPTSPEWSDVAQLLQKTGAIGIQTEAVIRTENLHTVAVDPSTILLQDSSRAGKKGGCSDVCFFYYIWANLTVLNALRTQLGLNTLTFVPSVYEQAPAYDQLVCSFLLGDVVHNVSSLSKTWIMQYLYMYCRIGVVLSPLRDNALSTAYLENPIIKYFHQGMRVSIATSDPLYFHHHESNPLVEEYATLGKVRDMTPMDLMELSRNSVLNSNFPHRVKEEWLGRSFVLLGSEGNDIARCGVCDYRLQFRHESLAHEESLLNLVLSKCAAPSMAENPMSLHLIPYAQSVLVSDLVQHFRHSRRMNYTDQRTVYPRIDIYYGGPQRTLFTDDVAVLRQVISLRRKYLNPGHTATDADVQVEDVFSDAHKLNEADWEYNTYYGVCLLSRRGKTPAWPTFIPPITEFIRDLEVVRQAAGSTTLQRLATHRLNLLEQKFLLHLSMNISNEAGKKEEKESNNRDFFTAYKVDTNVHTDAGPNARTLLEFFVVKAMSHGDDVVFEENRHPVTLSQLLERYQIDVDHITVDELNHHFSTHSDLRCIFLSPFNFMQGRYFAELTKQTLQIFQEDAFSFAENRLIITGASEQEWYDLARWFDCYGMANSCSRWMICLSFQYRRLRQQNLIKNFGELIDNIFRPLWEISLHPAKDAKFHYFLTHVSGFDCTADELKIDLPLTDVSPHLWNSTLNPPYNYYMYYLWANITSLNEFRASRDLSTFTLRPQCGEMGGVDHLISGFCLANSINQGVTLAQHPVLEYMWYIAQVGVAMSPLSNTSGASAYLENPFPIFFHRGLNVSLATNQPLYYHFTREPLVEEYSIAAKLWKMEFNDLSEIARNSVLQSGFPAAWKENALGPLYHLRSTLGNDVRKSHVSDIRVAYRYEVYHTELNFLDEQLAATTKSQRMLRAMQLLEEELAICGEVTVSPRKGRRSSVGNSFSIKQDSVSLIFNPASSSSINEQRLESRAEKLRREIQHLDAELRRMRTASLHVAGQNSEIAAAVNVLRDRLQMEGLSILGSLEHQDTAAQQVGQAEAEGEGELLQNESTNMLDTSCSACEALL